MRRKLFYGTASGASGGGAERISRDFAQNGFGFRLTNTTIIKSEASQLLGLRKKLL
jgi:hypothetical protein